MELHLTEEKAEILLGYKTLPSKLYQTPSWSFAKINRQILKFLWKCKGPRIIKTILKKSKVVELTLFQF